MKKTIAILLIFLMLFTSGCAVMTAAAPEPTPAPPTVEELLADALKYYNAGNYEEAILLYEAAIEIEPRNFDATVGLGKAYTRKNESDKAITCFRDAMEIKPDCKSMDFNSSQERIIIPSIRFVQVLTDGLFSSQQIRKCPFRFNTRVTSVNAFGRSFQK